MVGSIIAVLWRAAALLAFMILAIVLAESLRRPIDALDGAAKTLTYEMFPFVGLLIGSLLLQRFAHKSREVDAGLNPARAWRDLPIGIGIGGLWIGAALALLAVSSRLTFEATTNAQAQSVATAAMASLINVGTQQLLTRGYLFGVIAWRFGQTTAIVVTSLVFLLLHPAAIAAGPLAILNLLTAGLILAVARALTGSIWLACGIHFAWNFIGAVVLGLIPLSAYPSLDLARLAGARLWIGGEHGIETGLAVTLANVALLGALVALRVKRAGL